MIRIKQFLFSPKPNGEKAIRDFIALSLAGVGAIYVCGAMILHLPNILDGFFN